MSSFKIKRQAGRLTAQPVCIVCGQYPRRSRTIPLAKGDSLRVCSACCIEHYDEINDRIQLRVRELAARQLPLRKIRRAIKREVLAALQAAKEVAP